MHQFKALLLFIFILGSSEHVTAQRNHDLIIDKIEFEGAKKFRTSFLEQFIESRPGEITSDSLLQIDVQKLKNIAGVGKAKYRIDSTGQNTNIIFIITEVRTFIPIVKFGGIKDNFWFQLGFTDINWQGKGQVLSAAYQNNDRRHSGELYFRDPFFKNSKWGYSASLSGWASREPLYFDEGTVLYDYNNNSFGLTVIHNFGFRKQLEFGGTYFIEKYAKSKHQILENTPGPESFRQPKILTKIEYSENNLNYHLFYLQGLIWKITQQEVFNTIDKSWFHSLQFEGIHFTRIKKKGNLAVRLKLGISSNNESPFAPFVADSYVNLRGVGNRIDRGTAQAVLNIEYRQTLFESSNWGAQIVTFSDLGTWRHPGGKLTDLWNPDHFRHFVGGGLRLINNRVYGAVLRIDYGIDIHNKNKKGFVMGLGQYF